MLLCAYLIHLLAEAALVQVPGPAEMPIAERTAAA